MTPSVCGLNYAISIVKPCFGIFVYENIFYFSLLNLNYWCFTTLKILEKMNKQNVENLSWKLRQCNFVWLQKRAKKKIKTNKQQVTTTNLFLLQQYAVELVHLGTLLWLSVKFEVSREIYFSLFTRFPRAASWNSSNATG